MVEDLWFPIPVTVTKVSRLELREMELAGGWVLTAFTLLAPKPGLLTSWGPASRGPCVCSHSSQTTGVRGSGEGQCLLKEMGRGAACLFLHQDDQEVYSPQHPRGAPSFPCNVHSLSSRCQTASGGGVGRGGSEGSLLCQEAGPARWGPGGPQGHTVEAGLDGRGFGEAGRGRRAAHRDLRARRRLVGLLGPVPLHPRSHGPQGSPTPSSPSSSRNSGWASSTLSRLVDSIRSNCTSQYT